MFINFRERGREREKHQCERETQLFASCMCPDVRIRPTSQACAWPGIELTAFWCTGWWYSNHLSHLARTCFAFLFSVFTSFLCFPNHAILWLPQVVAFSILQDGSLNQHTWFSLDSECVGEYELAHVVTWPWPFTLWAPHVYISLVCTWYTHTTHWGLQLQEHLSTGVMNSPMVGVWEVWGRRIGWMCRQVC